MPYGLSKEQDTPENNKKMEKCVLALTGEGKDKESAIKICKSNLIKKEPGKQKTGIPVFGREEKMKDKNEDIIMFDYNLNKVPYKVESVDEDHFNIRNVEIFEIGNTDKGIKMDEGYINKVIEKHNKLKEDKAYTPTVFIGHNDDYFNSEKPAVGFFDNIKLKGKKVYVDFMDMFKDRLDDVRHHPYRSMECTESGEMRGIALLGSNPPYYKNTPLLIQKKFKEGENINSFSCHNLSLAKETLKQLEKKNNFNNNNNMTDKNNEVVKLSEVTTKFEDEKKDLIKSFTDERDEITKKFEAKEMKYQENIAKFEAEKLYTTNFSEISEKFTLSDKVKTGFATKEQIETVAKFSCTLNEEQRKNFYGILGQVKSVDLQTYGVSSKSAGDNVDVNKQASIRRFKDMGFSNEESEDAYKSMKADTDKKTVL